jgi:DNA (cytosine-5)-methyltransferase 1
MKSTLLDSKDAAKILNITPQQVRNLCRDGKLKSKQISGSWIINEKDAISFSKKNYHGIAQDQATYYTDREIHNSKKPIALSFFSGAMGLDIGLEQAGFNTLLACEVDNACRKTILRNRPKIALIGDIIDYSSKDIRSAAGLNNDDDIDLVIGGPPCQAFSTAGKRQGFEDERGNVFLTFLERIIDLRPKYAVIENVRGILSAPLKHRPHSDRGFGYPPLTPEEEKGGALMFVLHILRKAGYGFSFNLYNAANFGSPQKRERVIIVCSRDGKKLPYLVPTNSESGKFGLPRWRTFKEAVAGLSKDGQHYLEFPEKRLKYYRLLKPGQYWRHLPKELHKEALGASYYAGGGKTGFLRRLAWDEPAPTLVTHPAMPATDLAHPTEDRPLSIEEYKRVQEFPDDWVIEGSLTDQYKQVGNAVPVSLGRAVGKLIIDYIRGRKIKEYDNFPYSRYVYTNDLTWESEYKRRTMPKSKKAVQMALAL